MKQNSENCSIEVIGKDPPHFIKDETAQEIIGLQAQWYSNRISANADQGFIATIFSTREIIDFVNEGSLFYLMRVSHELVGFALITDISNFTKQFSKATDCSFMPLEAIDFEKFIYLYQLVIKKGFGRSGLGNRLLNAIFEDFQKKIILGDVLSKPVENRPSIKFFESKGFKKIGELTLQNYRDFGPLTSNVYIDTRLETVVK